jgi:hypothetical protein
MVLVSRDIWAALWWGGESTPGCLSLDWRLLTDYGDVTSSLLQAFHRLGRGRAAGG